MAQTSRRTFLKTCGLAASTLAIGPCFATSTHPNAHISQRVPTQPLRVGVLLPSSNIAPWLANSFRAGMQLALATSLTTSRALQLVDESYGYSSTTALQRMQMLIEQNQVDLLVGALSSNVASSLHPLLEQYHMPVILSGVGANVTRASNNNPYIWRNKLNYWQASWALGAWAARNQGSTALLATSFYESGYDAHYAFQLGFESAGGTVLATKVSHSPTQGIDSSINATLATIRTQQPDFVCAFYCGQTATDFVRAYAESGLAQRIPLLGSGFMVDETLLADQGNAALSIKSVQPWSNSLNTPENQQFTAAYQRTFGRAADHFALMGYDTARLIGTAFTTTGDAIRDPSAWRQALASIQLASPRGLLTMNQTANDIESPLYLREVRAGRNGLYHAVIVAVPGPAANEAALTTLRTNVKSGWSNAYFNL